MAIDSVIEIDTSVSKGESILESCYPCIPIPVLRNNSAVDLILEKAEENARIGRTKWVTDSLTGETLTFSQIEPMSKSIASAMSKRGMVKGDIALYMTRNVTRAYTLLLGVWRLGGCMYSSYPEDTADTILVRVQETKSKWIFCDFSSLSTCKTVAEQVSWPLEIIVFEDGTQGHSSVSDLLSDTGDDCPKSAKTELNDPALILCTSGTTGVSKGAVYTNKSLLAFFQGTSGLPFTEKPGLFLLRPTHVAGCLFPIRNIIPGTWSVLISQIKKENVFKAVHDYKPFIAVGFPTYLEALAIDPEAQNYDRTSLQIVASVGVVVNQTFYEAMKHLPDLKAVTNGYGMTECAALTTTIDMSGTRSFQSIPNLPPLTVGKLYPNTSVKILDLDTDEALGPNQRGEILIKSPIMCAGYFNRDEENRVTFKDGWMRTGDLGYYDTDGFLFVIDRIKETFKYFNNHISPTEIEAVIIQHPAVAEVAVFGVKDPNGGDHIPRAAVVLKPNKVTSPGEIKQFTEERIADYRKLRGGLFIVPGLPKGKTGKVVRSMISEMILENAPGNSSS